MTLSATPAVDRYTANGSQTVFDYNFKILDAAHLQVFLGDAVQGSGFTVSGVNNDSGGTVTFDAAPASGAIVTLRQEVPLDQPSALPNQGPFPSATVETQIADRIVMQNKQQQEELNRSVKVAVSSSLTDLDLTPEAGKFVAWNQDGDRLIGAEATPGTAPVSAFGATLIDDADAAAALGTLGVSDYVRNNLIQSASAEAHLATLLPAIDTVLETVTGLADAGIFHPALDEHPEWVDGVSGARSRFMLATAQTAGGNSTVKIWDLTTATPAVLQTVTLDNSVVSAISDIKGGVIAIATEDGLFRRGWTKAGFGAVPDGLPDPITDSTFRALTDNNLVDVCIGYGDQPASDPATGGKKPTVGGIYGMPSADAAFLLKEDGRIYDSSGTVGDTGCGMSAGWFYYPDIPSSHRMLAVRISEVISDATFTGLTFLANNQDPFGFGGGADFDITPGQDFAAASADGLTVGKVTGDNRDVDQRFTALVNRTYTTGWIVGDIKGAWLANSKTLDRSYLANALAEQGGGDLSLDAVATGAELQSVSGFTTSRYLERAFDADFDVGTGDFSVVLWFRRAAGVSGDEIMFHRQDAALAGATIRLGFNSLGNVEANCTGAVMVSGGTYDDGGHHMAVLTRRAGRGFLIVDGIEVATDTSWADNLDNGTAILRIGVAANTVNPFGGDLALARFAATGVTEAQARHMYETERRLFAANAKCLLQGAANAVRCVAIDPVTSDLHVGQADALMRFEGLLMAAARPASGETWTSDNHLAIRAVAGALALVNGADPPDGNVESHAFVPGIDLRDALPALAGAAARPGPDLSRAKAWVMVDTAAPAIKAAFNVRSVTKLGTGAVQCDFAVPMKRDDFVPVATVFSGDAATDNDVHVLGTTSRRNVDVQVVRGGVSPTDRNVFIVVFGELANE